MKSLLLKLIIFIFIPSLGYSQPRIACLGDSVTLGRGLSPEETFCYLIAKSLKGRSFNFGVGGDNTNGGISRIKDALNIKPHFLIIMFGLNDSFIDEGKAEPRVSITKYSQNIQSMIRMANKKGIKVILATSNPTSNTVHNFNLKPYVNAIRNISIKRNIIMVDTYSIFAEQIMEGEYPWFDGVHLTAESNLLLANEFIRKIRKFRREKR